MAKRAHIRVSAVEDAIRHFEDQEFDVVFTLAVLEHIHIWSEWIFAEMVRITGKYTIAIEGEKNYSLRHFPRSYRKVFESLGMHQIEERRLGEAEDFEKGFHLRVFKK